MKKKNDAGIFRRKAYGFTMLEVMVSVVIISAVALGVMGTVLYTKRASSITQQRMIAAQLIEGKLTELKPTGAAGLIVGGTAGNNIDITDPEVLRFLKNPKMNVMVTHPESGDTTLKLVVATVAWNYPWYAGTACTLTGMTATNCDKKEFVATLFFKE